MRGASLRTRAAPIERGDPVLRVLYGLVGGAAAAFVACSSAHDAARARGDEDGGAADSASKNVPVPSSVTKNVLGNTSFTIVDPDGHSVEWVQYEADSLTGRARGQAMPTTRIGGSVHHLGVTILDPAASDAFYEKALG